MAALGLGLGLAFTPVTPGGSSPPPFPVWLPQAPSGDYAIRELNYKASHFWNGSAEVTAVDMLEENLDWGSFSFGTIVPGSGMGSVDATAGPVMVRALSAALIASGFTCVATVNVTSPSVNTTLLVSVEVTDLPNYTTERFLNWKLYSPDPGGTTDGAFSDEFSPIRLAILNVFTAGQHRVALTISDARMSISIDGGAVQTFTPNPAAKPPTDLCLDSVATPPDSSESDISWTEEHTFYAPQPNADLPTLSAP